MAYGNLGAWGGGGGAFLRMKAMYKLLTMKMSDDFVR
jgi:hypothetical protein